MAGRDRENYNRWQREYRAKNKEKYSQLYKERYNRDIELSKKLNEVNYSVHAEKRREYAKNYRKMHLPQIRAYMAERRANKLKATPAWANLDKIKELYLNCPEGYHVDHIIPLKGKEVCGLHVESNLQYLPAIENIKKKNILKGE